MNQPPSVRQLFLERLGRAAEGDPRGWLLVEDLSREAFGLPALGLPIAGPTANGTLSLRQRVTVRRAIRDLSRSGLVEFAEQPPTDRRRTMTPAPSILRGRRRSIWARLAQNETARRTERRDPAPDVDGLRTTA